MTTWPTTDRADFPAPIDIGNANAERGWGPKWPHTQFDKMGTILVTDPAGETFKLACRKELGQCATDLMYVTEKYLEYDLIAGQCWGLSSRPIRGSNTVWWCNVDDKNHTGWPSNHSGGQALDFNPFQNPMQSQFKSDMPASMVRMWAKCGWEWGGWYGSRPDAMHYEYAKMIGDAAESTRIATAIRESYDKIDWNIPVAFKAMLAAGPKKSTNGCRRLQNRLNVDQEMRRYPEFFVTDGFYGDKTRKGVEYYQAKRGLKVDGDAGEETLKDMGVTIE